MDSGLPALNQEQQQQLQGLKRKASLLDSAEKVHNTLVEPSGLDSPQQQAWEAQAGGQEEEQHQEEEQLTETVKLGLLGVRTHEDTITSKIDELIAVGVGFLDSLKERFVQRMEKVKEEMREFSTAQASDWARLSLDTLEAEARLQAARALVNRLGLKAANEATDSEAGDALAAV